jgi:hypothetical protein
MAGQRSRGRHRSSQGSGRDGKKAEGSRSSARTGDMSTEQLQGRAPSGEPDVVIDIRKVKVDEVYVDVEHLEAHLALRATLANLLQVVAGVHVHLGKVEVDITGVEAEALMEVRLENLYEILDRALTTLDRNPEILESLVHTADDAIGEAGNLGQQALDSGGAVGQAADGLGQGLGGLGQRVGQTTGQAAGKAGQDAVGGQDGAAAGSQANGGDGVKKGGARWLIPLAAGAGAAAAVWHATADRETDAEARDSSPGPSG